MKILAYATANQVPYFQAYRWAKKALKALGREMSPPGRPGHDLKPDEMALCDQYLADYRGVKETSYTPAEVYAAQRTLWLETYARAIMECKDGQSDKWAAILATYAVIALATTSSVLQTPIDGARLGDLAVELAYESGVELDDCGWFGFTKYLLNHGFESPGWGVI